MDPYSVSHAPPVGATPTPTTAARPAASPAGRDQAPDPKVYVASPGTPFYSAALFASQHGYTELRYPDPVSGTYLTYPVDAAAMAGYARNTGAQTSAAAARASQPGGRLSPDFPGRGQSVPAMGGNASSLMTHGLGSSPLHPYSGTGTVWAASLLHSGPAGGVHPAESEAGGPEKGVRPARLGETSR